MPTVEELDETGRTHYAADRWEPALEAFRAAAAASSETYGPLHSQTLSCRHSFILANLKLDRPIEPLLEVVLLALESQTGRMEGRVLSRLQSFLGLCREQSLTELEERFCAQLLVEAERLHGRDHPNYGAAQNQLAECYRLSGRLSEAEQIYTALLTTSEPLQKATVLNNLALLRDMEGQTREAIELLEESLKLKVEQFGLGHPGLAPAVETLSTLYGSIGDGHRAERLWIEACTLRNAEVEP